MVFLLAETGFPARHYIVDFMGGTLASAQGLPGSGDLYVTCQAGRNNRMGRHFGLGMRYSEAKGNHMPDETVEGADLALAIGSTLEHLLERERLDRARLPLAVTISDVVCHDQPMQIPWTLFYK